MKKWQLQPKEWRCGTSLEQISPIALNKLSQGRDKC
jgi:hypothetical protein